jgi:hypothetical protein
MNSLHSHSKDVQGTLGLSKGFYMLCSHFFRLGPIWADLIIRNTYC